MRQSKDNVESFAPYLIGGQVGHNGRNVREIECRELVLHGAQDEQEQERGLAVCPYKVYEAEDGPQRRTAGQDHRV